MKDPVFYLVYAKERIEKIERIISKFNSIEESLENEVNLLAIERLLETLADVTKKFPEDYKNSQPDINWQRIKNFRNVMAHDYFEVDYDIVFGVLKNDIPELQKAIEELINRYGQ